MCGVSTCWDLSDKPSHNWELALVVEIGVENGQIPRMNHGV